MSPLSRFFLLFSLVFLSGVESSIDVEPPIDDATPEQLNDEFIIELQSFSLFSSLSTLFETFAPFSLFDQTFLVQEFDSDNSIDMADDESSDRMSFWSFSSPSFIMFFWSSSPSSDNELEYLPSLSKKDSQLYLSCPVCQWLMSNVDELIFSVNGISELEFDALLRVNCFEWGFSRGYCDMLIYDVVPQMISWIKAGNEPELFCECGYDGTSETSTGSTSKGTEDGNNQDSDGSEKYSNLFRSFVVILLGGLVFGMAFLSVRIFIYVKTQNAQQEINQTLLESDEEANASLPAYSDLAAVEYGQPPKYAFSAQDAALMGLPSVPPPQYSADGESPAMASPPTSNI